MGKDVNTEGFYFWSRIDELRKQRGLSLAAISENISTTYSNLRTQRSSNIIPKAFVIAELAKVLHTDIEYLLTGVHFSQGIPPVFYEILDNVRLRSIVEFIPTLSSSELDLLETFLKAMGYQLAKEEIAKNVG